MASATITTTTVTATGSSTMLELDQQRQRPLRGISIVIEAAQPPTPATAAATTTSATTMSNDSNKIAEMSLKSQAGMLLAFGDSNRTNNNNNNNNTNADHVTKDNLETSCNTEAATATATATVTKVYPQLLVRIGQSQSEDYGEISTATASSTCTAPALATTIISCNSSVLPSEIIDPAAAASPLAVGEMKESALPNDIVVVASQPSATVAATTSTALAPSLDAASSAVTETVGQCSPQHTVKIQIANGQSQRRLGKQISVVKLNDSEMILQQHQPQEEEEHQQQQHKQISANLTQKSLQSLPSYQLCYLVSSGQYSPSDTLDSGTGSDLESVKSPCSEIINVPKLELHLKTTRVRVNESPQSVSAVSVGTHQRAYSLTDSEECDESSSSSLSCDSLHSGEALPSGLLPTSLLRDIRGRERERERELEPSPSADSLAIPTATKIDGRPLQYESDQFYTFHVNELDNFRSFGRETSADTTSTLSSASSQEYESNAFPEDGEDAGFAGYRDVRGSSQSSSSSTIRSAKGTVRGVKNRVRNGVATFLQLQQPSVKNFMEKDVGKVVLYTTSMGIIRDTYAKCANVKQILRTLLIKFEERDVFMSVEYQQEMRERMHNRTIRVPQLFVEGQHVGDADTVERLNECGELRQLLRPYKSIATAYTCQTCGGYRLLPCPSCSGSKKSVHRNHFTAEFVALKCMNCDEVGLVKCPNC
ncbi:glutaredoxin domain-containing cysteine-rich protein CG12206 [Drosophila guanche]|uniref:Blast:Glutaredoxin domain-containing cysteine-rich protein CG12206 n=1 Tax=Drosophila guanche TaxID=7266 RepID=A0A3B0JXR3_DROGU|nr:glutaredoxin domain-containing cysteine-rich protein CG12206 [Drosophila guanche]SPP86857.1 blast:Glutaredoxin domain-containing cysteine-rich protein CG12206 [Drosophila guanche]